MTLRKIFTGVVLIIAALCVIIAVKSNIAELAIHKSTLSFFDWFTPAFISAVFISLAIIKFIGQKRGLIGGGGKPWSQRLKSGYCPTWSRPVNLAVPYIFLFIGVIYLINLIWVLFIS